MITSIKRIIKWSWTNFWRQNGLTLATCFVLLMAISLIASVFFMKKLGDRALADLQNKINVSVYFKSDALDADILAIKDEISQIPEVQSIEYISKDQALVDFTQKHQNDQTLLDSINEIGENPLLASLNIRSWQMDQYEKISEFFANRQSAADSIIEKVDYYERKSLIDRVAILTSSAKTATIVLSVILAAVAVLITFNTIRLTILNQKDEIAVQRLVGASNWFIRAPFLVQGTLAGVLSALVSLIFFALACSILSPKIEYLFADVNLLKIFLSNFWILLLIELATGIILGTLSSLIAIRKYLKV